MKLNIILFVLFSIQTGFAQEHSVNGRVYSEGEPLNGASLRIKGTNLGTITNEKGYFSIKFSKKKNNQLIISYTGHKSKQIEIDPKESDIGKIILELYESLDEIVISGTLKPVSKLKSPVAVEVYSQSFFKANPSPSIFESLESINGIRPQLNCNVCNTGDIHINGQEGSYTMVLIDGLPIVSGLSTVYGLSGIPQSLIERVEIVKGPASTLYGSEAIGGVINLITKLPENSSKLSIDSFVSDWGEINTDIGYKYSLSKKTTGLLGINYFNFSNPIDNNNDGFTDLTIQDRISIFNKFTYGDKLSFATRFVYEDRWGGQLKWEPKYRGGDTVYGENIYTTRFEAFGNYRFNKNLSFQFSYNNHTHNSAYGTTIFNANQTIGFGQLIWNKSIKNNDLLFGLAYRYTYYDDDTTATFNEILNSNQEDIYHMPGLFIQDEIKINESNTLLLGIRFDHNSLHGNIFTPRINYKLSNYDQTSILRLSFGTGYRVAQVFTEDHAALTGARDVIFLNDLEPEKSWNTNLNYVKKVYLKEGAIIDFDISIFKTQFSNKIIPDYDTNPNKIIYDNLKGRSISQGVSLNINSLLENGIRFNLGATYIDSYIKEDGVKTVPYLTEKFQSVWKFEKKWNDKNLIFDLTGTTIGPLRLPTLSRLDPRPDYSSTFSIVNIQLTKILKNTFEIYGGVKNIFDFTPPKNSIARSFDPFDKQVVFDNSGNAIQNENNPYALTFDPSYVFASNQGFRFFFGLRYRIP
ncbi:TonB-dependent receptor [Flavobacteriaceae bacterium]|nr:TonB-dependent receptor [Flavobacteriaceae bacterium]MDA9850669.1 TonB-dependent receptor [Flavobacteriaceae bacterium]MDB3874278.1 TonB-dependent receptor [Flavobacteriaceae bacterium]MDC0879171.1 TonB-dependent receptor [Flavobacteriaceae bacterium]MDC0923307.1 TonB-dependent receptor [Flavobacteriaceae bacterium]